MVAKAIKLSELAKLVDGTLVGGAEVYVSDLNNLHDAGDDEISFLADAKHHDKISVSKACAVIVPNKIETADKPIIRVRDPYLAAAIIHNHFLAEPFQAEGIHSAAIVGEDCHISPEISIAAGVVIADNVTIGQRVKIMAGTVIGAGTIIGDDSLLYPNVTIMDRSIIGARVIIHSGAVIGADGYGYATNAEGRHIKRPQVGNVIINDDVDIGANTCVDRATFGSTLIGEGVKIDNLVQIGHNVVIGAHCLLVSQSGIAGSAKLGRWVVLGGKAAINGHIELGDKVMVAGRAGVVASVGPGEAVAGMPAIGHKKWLRASITFAKLPDLARDVRQLQKMCK